MEIHILIDTDEVSMQKHLKKMKILKYTVDTVAITLMVSSAVYCIYTQHTPSSLDFFFIVDFIHNRMKFIV